MNHPRHPSDSKFMCLKPTLATLTVLATALPFLFPYTQPPSTGFWPLMFTALCGWVLAVVVWCSGRELAGRALVAGLLAAGLLFAALLASAIGLSQYFGLSVGMDPWIHPSTPGVAMGQLRQRNQQATLLSMGVWALLWVVAQTAVLVDAKRPPAAVQADLRTNGSAVRGWVAVLAGSLAVWALALLASGSAATASRTALAQWVAMLVLLVLWRASLGRLAVGLALVGLVMYVAAAWLLPGLLLQWTGFQAEGLFTRFGDAPGCSSRSVLWSNVLTPKEMQKLNMGALLGVGQGSERESRMVIMEYYGGTKGKKPVAFVGKGVTFDTGGISIKPANGMEDMKYDMGGSAAVVGLMKALSGRNAKVNAIGVVGLVENMPDGNAQRPSDVVTTMSGQTVEVLNTDAEGRLVLADALWYTQDKFQPQFMINLATLTGAIVIALGEEYAGLFSNNDKLSKQLADAGDNTGKRRSL